LIKSGVKLIIIACGTSSALAYDTLQKEYRTGIVGLIGPGSRAAANATRNGKIGLIATAGTVGSGAYQKRIKEIKQDIEVYAEAAPLLVPLIEGGLIGSKETIKVVSSYLKPLISKGIDTLILGCTHYPLLSQIIQSIMGPEVLLIDPAENTVKEARKLLQKKQLLSPASHKADYQYLVTGSAPAFKEAAGKLSKKTLSSVKQIRLS
jgi:glutamate racemase